MNIIAVDDERLALRMLENAIASAAPEANLTCFLTAAQALEFAGKNTVDVAFLDIEMSELNGLLLAKHLKDINGKTNIIFVTGHDNFMGSAFNMHASGYLLKPVDRSSIISELNNLRNPVTSEDKGLRIQCFGNFAVFSDGKPVIFNRPKSAEILAYLIDRKGASINKKELAAVLWEDKDYTRSVQSHLHILLLDMMQTLKQVGAGDIIVRQRGHYAVDAAKINCDYYRYETGDAAAVNSYHGEYMRNYSWAEFTTGTLSRKG